MNSEFTPKPLVSITFPIHRYHEYAEEALASILNQDYKEIEVLFLDNSDSGVSEFFDLSNRAIRYLRLPRTFGLSETLNVAIHEARGIYLARMDYDDISLPNRISKQVDYMEENPFVSISGTSILVIGDSIDDNATPGKILSRPTSHHDLKLSLISKNAFFHPTVMFRLSDIRKENLFYRPKYDSAEDLDLWSRASQKLHLGNLDVPLLKYRLHSNQYSRIDGANSNLIAIRVKMRHTFLLSKSGELNFTSGVKSFIRLLLQILKAKKSTPRKQKFHKFR